jgi:16S rRNA (uracil1498-N3)-methyltransferase
VSLPVFVAPVAALRSDLLSLDGAEARHAHVKRIRAGERVVVTDGLGAGAECEVVSVDRAAVLCRVLVRRTEPDAVPRLTVVQAVPKGEHADRAVDLLTEVGVDVIVPWDAARNVARWRGDKAAKGAARWRAVAVAAAKQARRLRFPEVSELRTTGEVADLLASSDLAVVLHESASISLTQMLDQTWAAGGPGPPSAVVVVVGPEGGITDEELESLSAAGGSAVRLGPTVLRSSSAGTVAAALMLSRTARWK